MIVSPDPDYDLVPPSTLPVQFIANRKIGSQCGACGLKFDYNQAYGFLCSRPGCPLGYNS